MSKKTTSSEKSIMLGGYKIFSVIAFGVVAILIAALSISCIVIKNFSNEIAALPLPEIAEGMRGEMEIDKNINESTIDQYLGRSDSVYRDVRMLVDEAKYEAVNGDSYLSGVVAGFEVIPFPYLTHPTDLPEEVGSGYSGKTLFFYNAGEDKYVANYKESMQVLEDVFPKDKNIFLMCGDGGYAGMTKKLLVSLGWDEKKIYNVGGYWYYEGENKVPVKMIIDNTETYAFWRLDYHNIDFSVLHEV